MNKVESLQLGARGLVKEAAKDQQLNTAQQADATLSARLTTASHFMNASVQLLDETLAWKENLNEFLSDQPDFLVVGVLGRSLRVGLVRIKILLFTYLLRFR